MKRKFSHKMGILALLLNCYAPINQVEIYKDGKEIFGEKFYLIGFEDNSLVLSVVDKKCGYCFTEHNDANDMVKRVYELTAYYKKEGVQEIALDEYIQKINVFLREFDFAQVQDDCKERLKNILEHFLKNELGLQSDFAERIVPVESRSSSPSESDEKSPSAAQASPSPLRTMTSDRALFEHTFANLVDIESLTPSSREVSVRLVELSSMSPKLNRNNPNPRAAFPISSGGGSVEQHIVSSRVEGSVEPRIVSPVELIFQNNQLHNEATQRVSRTNSMNSGTQTGGVFGQTNFVQRQMPDANEMEVPQRVTRTDSMNSGTQTGGVLGQTNFVQTQMPGANEAIDEDLGRITRTNSVLSEVASTQAGRGIRAVRMRVAQDFEDQNLDERNVQPLQDEDLGRITRTNSVLSEGASTQAGRGIRAVRMRVAQDFEDQNLQVRNVQPLQDFAEDRVLKLFDDSLSCAKEIGKICELEESPTMVKICKKISEIKSDYEQQCIQSLNTQLQALNDFARCLMIVNPKRFLEQENVKVIQVNIEESLQFVGYVKKTKRRIDFVYLEEFLKNMKHYLKENLEKQEKSANLKKGVAALVGLGAVGVAVKQFFEYKKSGQVEAITREGGQVNKAVRSKSGSIGIVDCKTGEVKEAKVTAVSKL